LKLYQKEVPFFFKVNVAAELGFVPVLNTEPAIFIGSLNALLATKRIIISAFAGALKVYPAIS